ncbi:MAG: hypothetical protein OEQ74_03775 [Gammaproteobacteria bacterium]|nr:hypothetical protein [Gammaproteobacteria bacterium]
MFKASTVLTAIGCALLLQACVSGHEYNPESKFADMRPVQPMKITGSRISRMVDPDDPNQQTLSPVSVMTDEDIARSGEINLGDYLQKRLPNMIGSGSGRDR